MELINTYIAPWVLPNQVFPIHCVWKPDKDLSKIVVVIPDGYELSDTLNFVQHNFDKNSNSISIDANDLKSNNYFGIILRYVNIIEDVEKRDAVIITFLNPRDEILNTLRLFTRIVRPKLELLDFPKEIVVTDTSNPKDLISLKILHKGFGTANLSIEVIHSGADISKIDSLYFKVMKEIFERVLGLYEEPSESTEFVQIDDHLVREIAQNILKQPFPENLPFKLDEEDMKQLKELLKDESKKEAVYRIVYSSLRSLLFAALLYYGDRHPVEDIKLIDGKIVATMKDRIDELTVRIKYYDSFDNEYQPLEAKIRVLDRRGPEKQVEFDVPINIEWKKDILKLED